MQSTQAPNNTVGRLALILGILAIPLFLFIYLGLPLGVAAVALGWVGAGRASRGEATNRGQALAGLVCGAIAVAATVAHVALRIASALL